MKFNIMVIFSWLFFLGGITGVLTGQIREDALLFAQGVFLFAGSLFFELLLVKESLIKQTRGKKWGKVDV